MSSREPKLLIEDILDSAQKILIYTTGLNFYDFTKDSKTVDAVIRNFEIMGEAANRLPDQFKDRFPQIDWRRIRGLETGLSMTISALITLLSGRSRKPSCRR